MTIALRINMTGMRAEPADEAKRYQAAVDMAVFAEQNGFDHYSLEEHHCADNGWLPSPLTLAAMALARTQRIQVGITALLVTLYDPIRLAEDIAVLDLVSNGRLSFVAGLGYRPLEYHAMDKSWEQRGELMDEVVDTLLKAWSGEPFDYKGQQIRVTPVPLSRPHPFFFIGGMSKAAARRAARFGLPFYPPMPRPDLEQLYYEELDKHGKTGFVYSPDQANAMIFIDPDPERAWQELGPYFLSEMQEYSSWQLDGVKRPSEAEVNSIDDVRQSGRFEIISPATCLQRLTDNPSETIVLHPLAGGIPLDRAWNCLHLFRDEVIAKRQP
jgi:alkanesulfonate monooxygenase SsuD/methylene tetrahydromethanopterin reductase-like flavin-dependent oxidoreductase (luciferase family)